jgi:hypothetical protein
MKRLWIAAAAAACLVPAGCRWFEPEPATVPYCPPGYTPYYYQAQPNYYYQSGQACPPGYVPTTQCLPATTVAPARTGGLAPVPAAAPAYTPPSYSPGAQSLSPGTQSLVPSGGSRFGP